jgi:hypothetical protein
MSTLHINFLTVGQVTVTWASAPYGCLSFGQLPHDVHLIKIEFLVVPRATGQSSKIEHWSLSNTCLIIAL